MRNSWCRYREQRKREIKVVEIGSRVHNALAVLGLKRFASSRFSLSVPMRSVFSSPQLCPRCNTHTHYQDMGSIEDAVDAAAHFIGPFLGKGPRPQDSDGDDITVLLEEALSHLKAINAAEAAAEPDAPYDASLVGVVYGLLDLITSLGILPHLSAGLVFSQRPQSVLVTTLSIPPVDDTNTLTNVIQALRPILEQEGTGVQPLLSQRALPDTLSVLAELSFSPRTSDGTHATYRPLYEKILSTTPVSRLLPVLTSFLQQDVPPWWKPLLSKELSSVPLRPHGVRHVIEFLSLSYLSKNSQVPQNASGPQAQIPLPLEAITQATRLITAIPSGMSQDEWFTKLAPQILTLLDGNEGKELSRAAGQIIAGGILNKKSTGAPNTIGWKLFAKPLQEAISPKTTEAIDPSRSMSGQVLVSEQVLRRSLRRLASIATSYSHAGLLKRLLGPVLTPLWALLNYTSSRPSLEKEWTELAHTILLRYLKLACEPQRIDNISSSLFWDGESLWTFGPGSEGGVEIRRRAPDGSNTAGIEDILSRIATMDQRINLLVSLLVEARIEDQMAGAIFLQTVKKWLTPDSSSSKPSLTHEPDTDPLLALSNAKLAQALANKFDDKLARSPQHVIELVSQLLQNYASDHQAKSKKAPNRNKPSRATMRSLVKPQDSGMSGSENDSDDIASFGLSILSTLVASPDFKRSSEVTTAFETMIPSLQYLAKMQSPLPIPPIIANAATNFLQTIEPRQTPTSSVDPKAEHRALLKTAFADLTSPEPPNRGWALSTFRKLIQDPTAFSIVDVPSLTQAVLSASVADPESYVYTAAIPVLVDLAVQAPNPTVRIIVDAFTDIDERSLRLKKEREIEEALDYRLRVGEIINNIVVGEPFWRSSTGSARFSSLKLIVEAALSLASRRGHRKETLNKRNQLLDFEIKQREEGEAAWGGPIPNLLDSDSDNPAEEAERNALLKIVKGWEDTGMEEDVRIRASALSILTSVLEKRLGLLSQATVDAGLQMVLLILTMEHGEVKGILRRAAVLVFMGLLKGMDTLLEDGKESVAGMGAKQMGEVEKVVRWLQSEDADGMVRDHAGSVLEGLETWRMKQLYKIRDESLTLGPDLGLEGKLRGLDVQPPQDEEGRQKRGRIVEEIE